MLADAGFDVDFEDLKSVARYIRKAQPERREIVVRHVGWIGNEPLFMTPEGVIGDPNCGEVYVFEPEAGSGLACLARKAPPFQLPGNRDALSVDATQRADGISPTGPHHRTDGRRGCRWGRGAPR